MAFGDLPNLMLTEYGTYVFPETTETTVYRLTPRYDAAGRTVTHVDFEIGLRWYVGREHGGSDLDVQEMERQLMRPGSVLKYHDRGLVDKTINVKGFRDINYGPLPGPLSLEPLGGGLTTRASWSVTFSIATCEDRAFTGIREWNYTVAYQIDADGNTTITTAGFLKIAANRPSPGSTKIIDSADAFREKVVPPFRNGFRRLSQSFDLAEARSKLSYTVVDQQIGQNAPGDGLISAKASESVVTMTPGNMISWSRALEGTYTVARGRNVKVAWDAFFKTLKDRLAIIAATIPAAAVLPVQWSFEDPDIYGPNQTVRMKVTYSVVDATMQQALASMGIWRPVPNASWPQWIGSAGVKDSLGPRGSANVVWSLADDKIIDLCKADIPPIGKTDLKGAGPLDALGAAARAFTGGALAAGVAIPPGLFPMPVAANSWLLYEQFVRVVVDTGRVLGKTLPAEPLALKTGDVAWDVRSARLPVQTGGGIPTVPRQQTGHNEDDTFVHQRVTPTVHVYLSGRALRYGFSIPQPQLVSVGGSNAFLMDTGVSSEGFASGIVGNAVYPIYGARWNYHYTVPGLKSIDVPPNPLLT